MNSTLRVNKTMMQRGCYAKWVGIFSSPLGIGKEDNMIVLKIILLLQLYNCGTLRWLWVSIHLKTVQVYFLYISIMPIIQSLW